MPRFDPAHPLDALRPAAYNPRHITEDDLDRLRASVGRFGLLKPVIADDSGLIIAGHQRTRAAIAEGRTDGPAYLVEPVNGYAEVRFDQLHNGTDMEALAPACRVVGDPAADDGGGFLRFAPDALDAGPVERGGVILWETQSLLHRHGDWGAAVVDPEGHVLSGHFYALARARAGLDFRVRAVSAEDADDVRAAFAATYGTFSYEHIERATWNQSWAQLNRQPGGKTGKSVLYERRVIPDLRRHERVLDFGAGHGQYAAKLRAEGYDVTDFEPYRKRGNALDVRAVRDMADRLAAELAERGRFDKVVCDSVLNSVDSPQAEAAVLTACAALCKPGGTVYVSGRTRERVEDLLKLKTGGQIKSANRRNVQFLDAEGFTGTLRNGEWFFQKVHSREEAEAVVREHVGDAPSYTRTSTSWQVRVTARGPSREAALAALEFEFDLPIPGGDTLGKSGPVVAAYLAATA